MPHNIISPCLKCIRETKNKNCYTCSACQPRADFTLASMGDEDAYKRFIAFEYIDVGEWKDEPNRKKLTEREKTYNHYEAYFHKCGKRINEQHNKNFTTMREIVEFLYHKYKVQRYIAKEILFVSRRIFINMLNVFEIKRLDIKDVLVEAKRLRK